jgi:cellulose synthase/poly-beta-1,6-N-acetylglucosamine synthase-like glycosyltransferase
MILFYFLIPIFIIYGLLLVYYWISWRSVPLFIPYKEQPATTISIIIPARNEAGNIASLLNALQDQHYPKELFEIIVIDDHSADDTAMIVQQFPGVKLIRLMDDNINSYKKKAIEKGIAAATGEWIVTTDADCLPGANWLHTLAAFREERQAVFITAPVVIDCNASVLQTFQAMDFMVLQGITGAAVSKKKLFMCNGANLGYTRQSFYDAGSFAGIDKIASGDDMLLMYKIGKEHPDKVYYLKSKEAIVSTQPMKTWKDFFNQRIRWASKAKKYNDKRILPVLLLVYLLNVSFLVLLIAGCWSPRYWILLAGCWIAKTIIELPLFISVSAFFNKRWAIPLFFFFQPLHIFYTIVSGFFSQWGKYEWKGRKVK